MATGLVLALQNVLTAVVAAFIYSILFYIKKYHKKEKEKFDYFKLGATILVGVGVGLLLTLSGITLTRMTMFEKLAAYAGIIALVESVLKMLYRRFVKNYPVN